MDCNHTTCKSTEATERHTYCESENKTFVTRLYDACMSYLKGKHVQYSFYRCGSLIFVEAIWEVDKSE